MSDLTVSLPDDDAFSINAGASVGIVVALPEELATLTHKKLKQGEYCQIGNTWIAFSGAGFNNATTAAQQLVEAGVQYLISWGCAAGLSANMKPGDVVFASQVDNGQRLFDTEDMLSASLQQSLPANITVHFGKLYSCNQLISNSQDKQRIHQQTQALALDMESAAIGEIAANAGIPFLVIRCVADPVNQDLPKSVIQALNSNGQVELPKLLRYLVWHPNEIKALIHLGLNFHAAQKTLKIIARELISLKRHQPELAN